jgi:hypothetical protein
MVYLARSWWLLPKIFRYSSKANSFES